MSQSPSSDGSQPPRAFAEFAFGSHTHVIDVSRPLAWLSPEEMHIDLDDPQQRRFGDYELIEKIGQGGMGVVYRARQHGLERDVAIKLLAAGPWASEEFIERFRREARSAARMQHPNIVEIYEFGHRDGLNFFSMRLIEGQSLAQRLYANGPMPGHEAARLLRTLAEAMDYAHRLGILHLDLKPGNVLMAANGMPLIADFGLARRIDAGHEGGSDEVSGSPSYMAPEQAVLASHPLTAATDIYGLGAVLYETLTGRPPFMGANPQATLERVVAEAPAPPRSLRASIPEDLEAICMKCLAKAPGDRYASAQALADDLRRFVEGRVVSVRPLNALQRLLRWSRREPKLAMALAVTAIALVIGSATTTWQWRQAVAHRDAAQRAEQVAKSERDRAAIASRIGAYLYAHSADTKTPEDRARGLIAWLRKRLPGDEPRQADALTAFAASVGNERPADAENLLATIVGVLGADYRQQMIRALQAGSDPNRNVYSAMLAWNDTSDATTTPQFDASLKSAIAERPDDPFAWQLAAVFCPQVDNVPHCVNPQAARTLVRIAPDNMYHWLLLLAATTDPLQQRVDLHEAAKRTRFDDYLGANYLAYAKAIETAAVPAPDLIARPARVLAPNERPESSIAVLESDRLPMANWVPLIRLCLPADLGALDPQMRADCLTVGTRLARSNGAFLSRMIGVALVRPLARDTPLAEEARGYRILYTYLSDMDEKLSQRQRMSYSQSRFLQDISSAGQMVALQRRIEFFGMPGQPPADWQPDDPNSVLSARERRDNMIAIGDRAASLVAQGQYAEAVRLMVPAERSTRLILADAEVWRTARFLLDLGKARTGLGQFAAAQSSLLDAWDIVRPFGPGSQDAHDCLKAIVDLDTRWNAAEPGKGHDASAAAWKRMMDEFEAGASLSSRP